MDELESRLTEDAERIKVDTSPELRARIEASLHAARDGRTIAVKRRISGKTPQYPAWWLSALTGFAALLLIVFFTNRNAPTESDEDSLSVGIQAPNDVLVAEDWFAINGLTLNVEPADLTRSLDEELLNLQSDLEKARDSVERDIKFAF